MKCYPDWRLELAGFFRNQNLIQRIFVCVLNNAKKCSSADTKPLHSLFCDFLTSVWLLVFVF